MKDKEAKRNYKLSDTDLCQYVGDLCGFMTRDIVEFQNFNIDATAVSALQTLGDAFELFPPDEVYRGDLMIAIEERNALNEETILAIKEVTNRAINKWGEKSGHFKKFAAANVSGMTDKKLLFAARNVHEQGTAYLTELTPEGLTQAMLDNLGTKSQGFEDAMHTCIEAAGTRDLKAYERIDKGNELYDYVVKYTLVGKQIWVNVNEAKYNDYIIYKAPVLTPDKVLNLDYEEVTTTFSWDVADKAETYQLQYKNRFEILDEWIEAYLGDQTQAVFAPPTGEWLFRCRGHNGHGYGIPSDNLVVIVE